MNAASIARYLCITCVYALIKLRLTFGGSSNSTEWCVLIEVITDLGVDMTNNPQWKHKTAFAEEPDPAQIPFPLLNPSLSDDVQLQLLLHGYIDHYINDMIGPCLHQGEMLFVLQKQSPAHYFSFHTIIANATSSHQQLPTMY